MKKLKVFGERDHAAGGVALSVTTWTPFLVILFLDNTATLYKLNELLKSRSSLERTFSLPLPLWLLKEEVPTHVNLLENTTTFNFFFSLRIFERTKVFQFWRKPKQTCFKLCLWRRKYSNGHVRGFTLLLLFLAFLKLKTSFTGTKKQQTESLYNKKKKTGMLLSYNSLTNISLKWTPR